MPGFNTLPAVGGGGGQANMTFVASIHMNTYNRSWAQGGTPGYYAMYSTNQENGYVYFVGATTTGGPLNRLINVTHSFTRIDVIAPQNDMVSLYKAKVKSTTVFNNPFAGFASFPSLIRSSGNFVLPNNALPLVNVIVNGGGGGGGNNRGGGGGGGGVVKLTAFQAVGTTAVTVGGGGGHGTRGSNGGTTYFGNVYALGGGGGAHHGHTGRGLNTNGDIVAAGGGAGGHDGTTGGTGTVQTAVNGLGYSGTPVFHGGTNGGNSNGGGSNGHGGGGGGAGGNGSDGGSSNNGGNGGAAHWESDIAPGISFGAGESGASYNQHNSIGSHNGSLWGHGGRGGHHNHNGDGGATGGVVVRYYIP